MKWADTMQLVGVVATATAAIILCIFGLHRALGLDREPGYIRGHVRRVADDVRDVRSRAVLIDGLDPALDDELRAIEERLRALKVEAYVQADED